MVSSVIDDKPVASTWLDRLRLKKGLTTAEDDDASGNPLSLDDFLRCNHHTEITATSSASDSPPSAPIPSDPDLAESPSEPNPGEWCGVMSDVLSELFNFGCSTRSSVKKFPRKQSNPKHCSVETPAVVPLPNQKRDLSFLPSVREFATLSGNKKTAPEKRERRRRVEEAADGVDEEEKGEKDLVGFSRSEVTVIDTSFKIWKSEKLVFRRRNVWKVRDKKGKSRVVSSKKKTMNKMKKKKKRKCDVEDSDKARKSKKMKISTSVPDNDPQYQIQEAHDDPESSNANRILLSRLPSKPRKEGSFGVHTSKKNSEPDAARVRRLLTTRDTKPNQVSPSCI